MGGKKVKSWEGVFLLMESMAEQKGGIVSRLGWVDKVVIIILLDLDLVWFLIVLVPALRFWDILAPSFLQFVDMGLQSSCNLELIDVSGLLLD